MKIKFVSPSPKAGETEHVSATIAHNLIAAGFAELCPLPRRGESGWLEARNEQAKLAGPPNAGDVCVPFCPVVEWGVLDRIAPGGQVLLIKRFEFDTFLFDEQRIKLHGFPEDCPASIVAKFHSACGNLEAASEALDEAKRKQAAADAKAANAPRWKW